MKLYPLLFSLLFAAVLPASGATSFGVNFNNGDTAGAQIAGNLGGAAWTNVDSNSGTGLAISGTPSVTMNWESSNFYIAGSYQSTTTGNAFNTPIALMRVYLDDGDGPSGGGPGSLGAVNGDNIGVTINLTGMSAWLAAEGAASYTIHAYFSTDTDGATFQAISARDGGSVTSSVIETLTPTVQGNGRWDGTSVDPGGDSTTGTRGDAVFSTLFTQDSLTLTLPVRDGSSRGTLAGFVITAVPEPSSLLLGGLGALGLLRRRRA